MSACGAQPLRMSKVLRTELEDMAVALAIDLTHAHQVCDRLEAILGGLVDEEAQAFAYPDDPAVVPGETPE